VVFFTSIDLHIFYQSGKNNSGGVKVLKLLKTMDFIRSRRFTRPRNTGWLVSGLGLAVSAFGSRLLNRKVGAGILGFGLAHILLGQLDRLRPTIKDRW